jgi:hypothetical protein
MAVSLNSDYRIASFPGEPRGRSWDIAATEFMRAPLRTIFTIIGFAIWPIAIGNATRLPNSVSHDKALAQHRRTPPLCKNPK